MRLEITIRDIGTCVRLEVAQSRPSANKAAS